MWERFDGIVVLTSDPRRQNEFGPPLSPSCHESPSLQERWYGSDLLRAAEVRSTNIRPQTAVSSGHDAASAVIRSCSLASMIHPSQLEQYYLLLCKFWFLSFFWLNEFVFTFIKLCMMINTLFIHISGYRGRAPARDVRRGRGASTTRNWPNRSHGRGTKWSGETGPRRSGWQRRQGRRSVSGYAMCYHINFHKTKKETNYNG